MNFKNWFSEIKIHKKKILVSLFFLAVAITFYMISGNYLTNNTKYATVPDLILDNFGPYNFQLLQSIFVWGFILIIVLYFTYPLIFKTEKLYYVISMFSLFLIVRSMFVIFTHLGIPDGAVLPTFPGKIKILDFTNALFFSGHTGLPFLGFLIYRKEKKLLGYIMLFSSILLAIIVLLMHIHYSIDVFSAYFITYGLYKIGNLFIRPN